MHDTKKQRCLAIFLVVATFAPFLCAQQPAGRVSGLRPHATRQGKPLQQNDVLFLNDLLKTDKTGRLRVRLEDGSLLTLGGSSQMRVTQHDASARQTAIELQFGRLRSEVNALTTPGSKFEVRTAAAVAGVIGTKFLVVETDHGTYIYCYEGQVSVTSLFGLGSVTLSAGQFVLVTQTELGKPTSFLPGDEIVTEEAEGGSKLSGFQIGGIVLGAIGGTLGGVIATTGNPGDTNALPTPTPLPTPCNPNITKGCIGRLTSGILTVPRGALISAPSASLSAKQLSVLHNWPAITANRQAATAFAKPSVRIGNLQSFLPGYRPSNNWLATRTPSIPNNRFATTWLPRMLVNHPALARTPLTLQVGRVPVPLQLGRTASAPQFVRTPALAPHSTLPAGAARQHGGTFVPGLPGLPAHGRH